MQLAYRTSRRHQPKKDDTLVSSPEQARKIIADLDAKLKTKLKDQERATYLCARAVLYEALGDQEMLVAAEAAFKFSKTAQSCALVAVALHHFGRVKEALQFYEQAYRFPHEHGFEISIGYSNALLFKGEYLKAWPIVLSLKKRMVYAAFLPTWDGKPTKELQVISEGGFGDIIFNSRYLQKCTELCEHVTVFLPKYFFDSGFVDLARQQDWYPEIKLLTEARPGIPSAGFFDLMAIFKTTLDTIPPAPEWETEREDDSTYPPPHTTQDWDADWNPICVPECERCNRKPVVGICWAARASETPICGENVYRAISRDKAQELVQKLNNVRWVNLQKDEPLIGAENTDLKSWPDTAAVIANLDAVVTVDTAIMHLAASMQKPTYVLLSGATDWKFGLEGSTCPWYPTVKLFRNEGWGFDRAIELLTKEMNTCQNISSYKKS